MQRLEFNLKMLKNLENNFSLLEKKILRLKENYQLLSEEYNELSRNFSEMKEKYDAERKKNQELVEEQKDIKLQSAIAGNPEYNRLMKNHINRLIKEIDTCIAQLQNDGL